MKSMLYSYLSASILFLVSVPAWGQDSAEVKWAKNHGALGKVTFHVIDSRGRPVEEAVINLGFWKSDSARYGKVVKGTNECKRTFHCIGYDNTQCFIRNNEKVILQNTRRVLVLFIREGVCKRWQVGSVESHSRCYPKGSPQSHRYVCQRRGHDHSSERQTGRI